MNPRAAAVATAAILTSAPCFAAVTVAAGFDKGGREFRLDPVPPPSRNDAATTATITLVDGRRDGNSGETSTLNDGRVPYDADEPSRNFFFQNGSNGGRIEVDLGRSLSIKAVHTYSWHPRARGPQVYRLYAAKGGEKGFTKNPARNIAPESCGWVPLARVDSRSKGQGGQHAVAVSDTSGSLGEYRHLLLDFDSPDARDPQANTFMSEIDVIDVAGPAPEGTPGRVVKTHSPPGGGFKYVVDSTIAPDLTEWTERELLPVVFEWYPKIVALLPGEGYQAPRTVVMEFRDDMGGTPAYAAGNKLSMSAPWFRKQLNGEAKGCVVHELVHVVQNYWQAGRTKRTPSPAPGWVTEGIADYVRWFLYEPQSKGAEITKGNIQQARYDASYRTTANFLNWVIRTHDKDFLRKLNTAAREGEYSENLWKDATGRGVQELGADWKAAVAEQPGF